MPDPTETTATLEPAARDGWAMAEPPQDVRGRILSAARDLVARKGPLAMTVRDIAVASGANVAAVNYYFGSKRALIEEVLVTIFAPVNALRDALLREAEALHAPDPVPVVEILQALVRPLLEPAAAAGLYLRALQQVRAAPAEDANVFVFSTFDPVAQHFIDALHRALPHFSRTEVAWRYELARGAAVHVLSNCDPISPKMRHLTRASGAIAPGRHDQILAQVVAFAVGGFSVSPQLDVADLAE